MAMKKKYKIIVGGTYFEETRTEEGRSMMEVIARVIALRYPTKDPDYIEIKVISKELNV